ncbi:TPA: GHKL domain-containing protein, partial [Streptococcus equi subsp. equi]|nr:GHKL domain-containing protein [Streptococcus equi subsp. equi]HEK9578902.1 GHKL domain-containing protein [Streptococcus equi subsp. equi]HEK9692481.1 GHKL domain-containing protein [Streptococcus equi subsp. equi]HEK9702283.1 GHKL domain-containing protein [Streptococcus equi subsp. equi]HEK9730749.1 GHKL domain-containing protein [Streptococcus equi subsp. equi]
SQWEEEKSLSIKDHLLILEFLDLENSKIKTEPQLLLRIMENLITNAVNYSVKGTSININVEEINGMLKISVINDVSPNLNVNWNMVTSKFYRGDLSRRISNNGSGLGLTIVNDIVKHLGGNFEIGEENKRVCAKVILPYRLN